MARQAYQEQLLKLNGELIEMGDLCEEAMSLVMKATIFFNAWFAAIPISLL